MNITRSFWRTVSRFGLRVIEVGEVVYGYSAARAMNVPARGLTKEDWGQGFERHHSKFLAALTSNSRIEDGEAGS